MKSARVRRRSRLAVLLLAGALVMVAAAAVQITQEPPPPPPEPPPPPPLPPRRVEEESSRFRFGLSMRHVPPSHPAREPLRYEGWDDGIALLHEIRELRHAPSEGEGTP